MFFGRNDAKAETPILWPPHVKSWLIGKDSDAGRDWGQEEKGTTEDEMAGWHHWLDGRESEWTPGVGDRQGGLACCNSWGRKESDTTERLNWTDNVIRINFLTWGMSIVNQLKTKSEETLIKSAQRRKLGWIFLKIGFIWVQLLSCVRLFATPWIAACQASLSITNSRSLLKLMSIKLVMPSSHLFLCRPLLLLPLIPPSIRVFSNESALHMRWPKYWSFSFSISLSNEHLRLISFRMDWDGLGGSPCNPRDSQESSPTPQFKSINSSALSFLHSPTLTSIYDYWKNHSLD